MKVDFALKKKDVIQSVATAFLPKNVLIPLEQESGVACAPLVRAGDRIQEGQVIAEDSAGSDSAKIHSSIPGVSLGVKKCALSDGRFGNAIEIKLSGSFSHTGKIKRAFDWQAWGGQSLLNRTSALGVVNTFMSNEARSLSTDIKSIKDSSDARIFVRLFDEDPSCQTDATLAKTQFDKILLGVDILKEIIGPKEIVFAYEKNDSKMQAAFLPLKQNEINSFLPVDTKDYPSGKKASLAARYKKVFKTEESERNLINNSLFIDAETLVIFSDSVVYNVPVERVYVCVSGDCLKSSAVLKVCVGESFRRLALQLGLEPKKIGKIVVNGLTQGRAVPSLDTPVSKSVKSVAFISKTDLGDYSSAFCLACGRCRSVCPAKIYPDMIFSHVVKSIKMPQDFVRSSLLCLECGACNSICPSKIPLRELVKILKDKQNA